ncbi:very-long-chain (3R)-3-hydroxyacyl-CoA dehydratase-like isoform X2 [Dysidea avara]|uniref:very-long-chain (3R)-3-hydroxyacyl-CoA dehydratase-like isoform X2 n=1 Tax=Dysidea avara TaxID=196820 RepID=UPI003316775A
MSSTTLHPTVIWGQRKEFIFLRVMLQSCEKPDFTVKENQMEFKVIGVGLSGRQEYGFKLTFYDSVNAENMRVILSDKEIQLRILKKEAGMWPKLQLQQEKPHWLRLDFDLMQESSDEGEGDENDGRPSAEREMMRKTVDELQQKIKEAEGDLKKFQNVTKLFTTGYLLIYNCVQWSGFVLILVNIMLLALKGKGSMKNVYDTTGSMMRFCVLLAGLEIVHVQLKMVKGGLLPTTAQVLGRMFILFVIVAPLPIIQTNRVVTILFVCWSSIEVIRYPFYILALLNREIYMLTWLRYTAWIVLYPAGLATEASIVYHSLPHAARTEIWSLRMPNNLNFAFDFVTFLWVYLIVLSSGSSFQLMYMWRQRKKKLEPLKSVSTTKDDTKTKKD